MSLRSQTQAGARTCWTKHRWCLFPDDDTVSLGAMARKVTLLKYLSARRVGGGALPTSSSIHYVSQTSADDMGFEAEVADGEQFKFLAVAGKDKYWREMTAEEQRAALQLGWTAETWDGGDASPMEGLHWAGMSAAQVSAAEVLGHNAATWDLEMTPEAAAAAEAAAEAIRVEATRRRAGPRPLEVVLRADMERSMLMEQVAGLEAADEDLSEEQHRTLEVAHERYVKLVQVALLAAQRPC